VKNYEETELIKPSEPYLPEIKNRKFTLVLDLDETLVHYVEEEDSAYIQIRPGAENFLEEMHEYYEIIIFTAAMQDVIIFF
jgi:CTD small phosphatase-like protein 2